MTPYSTSFILQNLLKKMGKLDFNIFKNDGATESFKVQYFYALEHSMPPPLVRHPPCISGIKLMNRMNKLAQVVALLAASFI